MRSFSGSGARGPAGAAGSAGAVGPTGPQGAKGDAGSDGAIGPTGPKGDTGAAGSANISGTLNRLVKFTPDGTTGGDSAITDNGTTITATEPTTVQVSVAATKTTGIVVENPTAADAGTPIRYSPSIELWGHIFTSGADRTEKFRIVVVPVSGGNEDVHFDRDLGAGAGYATIGTWTNSDAANGLQGLAWNRILINSTSGGLYYLSDTSRVHLEGDGGLALYAWHASAPVRVMNRAASGDRCRIWSKADSLTAADVLCAWGFGATWPGQVLRVMADGALEGPDLHTIAAVQSGTFSATAHNDYMVDLSGNATANIPAASAANAGHRIRFNQTVAGASTLTITPASGTIEGQATFVATGVAAITNAIPGISVTIRSQGVGAGSPGWKVI